MILNKNIEYAFPGLHKSKIMAFSFSKPLLFKDQVYISACKINLRSCPGREFQLA